MQAGYRTPRPLQHTITGISKGAGMIRPNMATMLAFVFTDAEASDGELASLISDASDKSFNCVSVEGHTSTNDSLIILANGASGAGKMLAANKLLTPTSNLF